MNFLDLVKDCAATLTLNKMRTGLAVLGIIIGIGSVIALIALGQGSQKAVEQQIQSLGSNLLTISSRGGGQGPIQGSIGAGTSLTLADAEAIKTSGAMTTVADVSPEYSGRRQVTAGRNNTNTQIIGAYPQYAVIHKLSLASGSFITQRDVDSMTKVAVLGPQVAEDLFGAGVDPVGQTIRVQGQVLRVIGMTVSKGGGFGGSADDAVYAPFSTAQKQLFGVSHLTSISVETKSSEIMTQAQDEIGYFLLARHKINDPEDADFVIMSQQDILSTVSQVTGTFTALLGGIAAISLLVGGIGIMNIMLVTVTERTREIGLRKALGAKKKIIIYQFLIEAVILTAAGGLIGMLLGISASYFLSKALSLPFTIAPTSIALAIGVSGAIGIIFGWYPARKASNLQPIEALRYE